MTRLGWLYALWVVGLGGAMTTPAFAQGDPEVVDDGLDAPDASDAPGADEPPVDNAQPEAPADPPDAPVEGRVEGAAETDADASFEDDVAPNPQIEDERDDNKSTIALSGYFRPGFGFRYRPDALPRDEYEVGFFGDAGLIVDATPFEHWSGRLHIVFTAQLLEGVVSDVTVFDLDGDGNTDGVEFSREGPIPGIVPEEISVTYQPWEVVGASMGVMRIPFTLQSQSPNSALLFPGRSPPNQVFISGSDIGVLLKGQFGEGHVTSSVGIFNGDSLGLVIDDAEQRGVVFSGRLDVNPFGSFPFDEGDRDGPFRLGLGGGLLYRPAEEFVDGNSYSSVSIQDVRFSGSIRMAYAGIYLGVEALRRQQTDDFSSRPRVANGAFAQASFFFRIVDNFALEPIGRLGFVVEDDSFDPRTTGWTDIGLNLYPAADRPRPDDVRLTLQYLGERRFTERETAHGGVSRVQLKF